MRRSMARGSTSIQIATPSFMVTASGWAPPMPPRPAVRVIVPGEGAAELLRGDGGEGLVGALEDALGADVDPGTGGHLPVHGQAEGLQAAELLPVGPVADEVGVGDQDARRPLVGLHDADRAAGLDEHRLVLLQGPAACGPWRRRSASRGPPCRCRRRRRACRGARRPRGRGCSAASAGRLPAAIPGRSVPYRAALVRGGVLTWSASSSADLLLSIFTSWPSE